MLTNFRVADDTRGIARCDSGASGVNGLAVLTGPEADLSFPIHSVSIQHP